jgi:transposase-like protein
MRNILCKLPEKARPGLKKLIQKAFRAQSYKRIRTANLLERLFGEGQRRSKVIPRFMNEQSGLSLMFAVLVDASAGWRGMKISSVISLELDSLKSEFKAKPGVRLAA